jgi:isopentenyl-diphosphate Delta-isomerase
MMGDMGMFEEMLDVLTEDGLLTQSQITKQAAHGTDGQWHKTVHVWIVSSERRILLQRRSAHCETGANQWDISVAGHIQAGESSLQAVYRECIEEIGLDATTWPLEFLFCYRSVNQNDKNKEFSDVYVLRADIELDTLMLLEKEVSQVKWVDFETLNEMANSRDPELVYHHEIPMLMAHLKQRDS